MLFEKPQFYWKCECSQGVHSVPRKDEPKNYLLTCQESFVEGGTP